MDLHYLGWVLKRSLVASLLYVIACLVIWLLLGARNGWVAFGISAPTWLVYISVHAKDHRVEQRYYKEHRDRFL